MSNILDNTAAVAFTCPYCHTQAAGLENAGGMTCPRCSTTMERSNGVQRAAMTDSRKAAEQAYGAVCAHGQLARSCNICELERDRDSWKAKAEANERDKLRMDYLEYMAVKVGTPKEIFWCMPTYDRGVIPSRIRAEIDGAISAEKEKE